MAATTAVVAGTAGAVRHHQEQKYAGQAQSSAGAAAGGLRRRRGRCPGGGRPAAGPGRPAPTDDLMAQLSKLADLKAAGILSDEEFTAAKAKLLA